MIHVTVWNEYRHELTDESVKALYPEGIHKAIASFLGVHEDIEVRCATLDEPEHGLTDAVLDSTDVMIWWGHMAHHLVEDAVAEKVKTRVLNGMGLIVLHSGHLSKPFVKLIGTSGSLKWREGDRERVWCCNPGHPIAQGIPEHFDLEIEEMYGEPFDIPQPDELIFISWFKGGEVFRSGCAFRRGYGKIFYFRPGHEAYPTFQNENVQRVILNAVRWAAPTARRKEITCPCTPSLEG